MEKLTPKNKFLLSTFSLMMSVTGCVGLISNGASMCGGRVSSFSCHSYSGIKADILSLIFIGAATLAIAHMLQLSGHIKARKALFGIYAISSISFLAVKAL